MPASAAPADGPPAPGFRTLARHHDFTVLWVSQTISELGSRMSMFTFPLLGYALTGSVTVAALAEAAHLVGMLGSLLPAGLVADRLDRRLVLRTAEAVGALTYLSLAVAGLTGRLGVPHLLAAAFVTGAAMGLVSPAMQSAVRSVVPPELLPVALSQNQARQHVAGLLGAPVGGLLYSLGRWVPFLADAVSYGVSWLLLGRLRADLSPVPSGRGRPPLRTELAAGWRYIFGDRFFRVLGTWSPLANLTINAVFLVATLRLIEAGYPAWQIGLVDAFAGACGILGAVCAPALIRRVPTGLLMILVAWSFVPLLVPMAIWNHPAVVCAALSLGLFLNPSGNAGIGAFAQSRTPVEMIGRYASTMQFTSMSVMWLAPLIAGALLGLLDGTTAVLSLAGLCALVALIPTLSPAIWAVPRPDAWAREGREVREPISAAAGTA